MGVTDLINNVTRGKLKTTSGHISRFGSIAGPSGGCSFQFMLAGDQNLYSLYPKVGSNYPLCLTKAGDEVNFSADKNNVVLEKEFENLTLNNSFLLHETNTP